MKKPLWMPAVELQAAKLDVKYAKERVRNLNGELSDAVTGLKRATKRLADAKRVVAKLRAAR